MDELRSRLVEVALEWERRFGVAPSITSALSELDAANLVGMSSDDYMRDGGHKTAVTKGVDFTHQGCKYQVKANRPSGKPGSKVTLVAKARNLLWDRLIWILYDESYDIVEAWMWEVEDYRRVIGPVKHVRPPHMREGTRLFPTPESAAG